MQHAWSPTALTEWLTAAIAAAADRGATVVFLPEVTLSRYPADVLPDGDASALAEDLETGPTVAFARAAAAASDVYVHTSLYRARRRPATGSGSTPRSWSRRPARSWPAPTSCTSR